MNIQQTLVDLNTCFCVTNASIRSPRYHKQTVLTKRTKAIVRRTATDPNISLIKILKIKTKSDNEALLFFFTRSQIQVKVVFWETFLKETLFNPLGRFVPLFLICFTFYF